MDFLLNPIVLAIVGGICLWLFFLSGTNKQEDTETVKVLKEYSRAEVSKHTKKDDVWIIVDNGVYNVTDFVPIHPGLGAIFRGAGKDCSKAMREEFHPSRVWSSLEDYLIGSVPKSEFQPILPKLNI